MLAFTTALAASLSAVTASSARLVSIIVPSRILVFVTASSPSFSVEIEPSEPEQH